MLKLYGRMVVCAAKTFGWGGTALRWLVMPPAIYLFTRVTMALDGVFFPGCRHVEIRRPIFIMGGRSGTTYLHRLLHETREFSGFETWHVMFPALTARALVRPLVQWRHRRTPGGFVPAETGHAVHIMGTPEEDELLFLHVLDTQFVTLLQYCSLKDCVLLGGVPCSLPY